MHWQELHLQMTVDKLAAQPLSQMTERADREQQLGLAPRFSTAMAALVVEPGWEVVMPFRIGYPKTVQYKSPRRAVVDVLIN